MGFPHGLGQSGPRNPTAASNMWWCFGPDPLLMELQTKEINGFGAAEGTFFMILDGFGRGSRVKIDPPKFVISQFLF